MNSKTLQFPNIGVLTSVLSEEDLAPLKEEILEIQNNFNQNLINNNHEQHFSHWCNRPFGRYRYR
jgi:Zn-dependent M16 (insulinase) family peptidase